MLDSFGEGFIAFDADWRITYCNRLGAAHYGLDPQDLIGAVAWTVSGMAEDEALREFLERARTAGTAIEAETPSEIQSQRWYYLRAFPLQGGVGLSSRDVTERVEQTRREREQAARLELALATARFGDWRWNPTTDMVDLSPRAAEMVGVPPGEVMTWTEQLDYLHADDRDRAQAAVVHALTTGTLYEIEYRFTRPADDIERWMMVRGQGQYDEQGRPTGMHGVLTDITDQKAEAARVAADRARLAESEQRFRAMADSAPSPVWVTDERGGLEFANQAFQTLAGRSMPDLRGDGWISILHPEDRARIAALRAVTSASRGDSSWEARFRINGEWRWMRTASSARFDDDGVFRGYVGMAMDVTDTRRAEERQTLLINELNHRVKNTLATIQSLARQTLREGVSPRDARERLTERLLALSAAHNVLTRENWEGADLTEIAREAVRPYDDTGARIETCGPPARLAPHVALAVSMALHELATNALKYGALSTPEGQVALAWTLAPSGDAIELAWRERGGPPVSAPATTGFGSRLLAGLAGELGAPADIRYDPSGLSCRLRAPTA